MKKRTDIDSETRNVLSDQEKIKRLTEHEGWAIVRALLLRKATELLNIADINIVNPVNGNLVAEIGMRQLASARLIEILKDVEGTAEQFDANAVLSEQVDHEYIIRPSRK